MTTSSDASPSRYRRILLKISGEALQGDGRKNISPTLVKRVAREILDVHRLGIQIGVVLGGGNFIRGLTADELEIDRVSADYMGMLGTLMNALAMQNVLESMGLATRVLSAITVAQLAEPLIRRRAIRHLEKGRVVIFACGTGNPYFSTDTAAVLRAVEIHAEVLLKATKVDGVYDKDPVRFPDAQRYSSLTYTEAIERRLAVMDTSALALCRENRLPVIVYSMREEGNLVRTLQGDPLGTLISEEARP